MIPHAPPSGYFSHAPSSSFPHAPSSSFPHAHPSGFPHAPPSGFVAALNRNCCSPSGCFSHAPPSGLSHAPPSGFVGGLNRNLCSPYSVKQNDRHAPLSGTQLGFSVRCRRVEAGNGSSSGYLAKRRDVIVAPLIAIGASVLKSAVAKAEEKKEESSVAVIDATPPGIEVEKVEAKEAKEAKEEKKEKEEEEVINSRIYDATVIGDPMVVGKESRKKVWEKLMNARVIYLGEAEQVPIGDDKDIELDIVKQLHKRCLEGERHLSLALEAFPVNLQEQLSQFMTGSISGEVLKMFVSHWAPERWQEYEPLLNYCRDNGVRLVACGLPLEILRTIQSEGIRGLPKADRKKYAPPAGSGFISGFTAISRRSSFDINYVTQFTPFEPSSYLSTQARAAEDYTMSQVILEAVADGGASELLVVVTGASHVTYGPRGTGVPARITRKLQKKNQAVILLNPERQHIRREGEVPVADFLWYSSAKQCNRNCYDRAEIARVMNAAGRKRDALPQDLQKGLDLGLVSPEVLQNFFDLEKYPLISELTHRFQGFRERLLADPKFLQKLAIEESISITTTLIAQYEKRKENFFEELDYVITDSARGAVVDFFTVWLPAPTLSFLTFDEINTSDSVEVLKGLLGSIPDNAFQKNLAGRDWDLSHRVASVFVGGLKLAMVGFVSSIGAVASSNGLYAARKFVNPSLVSEQQTKRSPILKTAVVYGSFLGISANLRYQFIAGIVEHRISELIPDQALFVNMLSFVARTLNSYWGTQQWIDLARFTGLQSSRKSEQISYPTTENSSTTSLECNEVEETSIDEINSN